MTALSARTLPINIVSSPGETTFPLAMRLAVMVALITDWLEYVNDPLMVPLFAENQTAIAILMALCIAMTPFERFTRLGVGLYALIFGVTYVSTNWPVMANHTWLFLWCIPVVALLPRWHERKEYSDYIRLTLGVVMLAAAAQKIVAGTYLDGTYIASLSFYGQVPEQSFRFLCSEETLQTPCLWHRGIGSFIVIWQIFVGLFLIAGYKSFLFIAVEVAFLIGAGLYADEMNFQTLNIALLCIAFRIGLSLPMLALCAALLAVDLYSIAEIMNHVL